MANKEAVVNHRELQRFERWWRQQTPIDGDPVLRWVPAASTRMWRGHAMVVWSAAITDQRKRKGAK